MSETPIREDGSQLEETRHNPSLSASDGENVDNVEQDSDDQAVDPRLALMESISAQNDEDRRIKAGIQQEDMPAGEPVPEPGLQTQEQMHPEEEEDEGLPEEYADDPLAEFIEMDGDEPMLRTVVNGQQQLIPLEKARASLQKNMAADARLQEASEAQKRLEERERELEERERALQANQQRAMESAQPPSTGAGLSDEQLEKEAQALVGELFTGTQEEAAAKLAKLVSAGRSNATPLNADQIAERAVTAAREQLRKEAVEKDAQAGFAQFKEDYPEIASDAVLFQLADGMTPGIQREHPDWMPSQVMAEAGRRTSEWVKAQRGESGKADEASEQTAAQTNERNERKRKLRRVPRARQGKPPVEAQAPEATPADVVAEMRKARGLPD